jgi:carboxyl-terminal processing protease
MDMPIKGYIVDLRDNPGGLLDEAIAVADDFLEKGAILMVKARVPEENIWYNARPGDVTGGKPIVIIINHGAAAESEVVAAALQDHKRATVIGTRSLGKGSVMTFGANGPIRVEYYTPSGRSIQAKGIDPDVIVERQPPEAKEPENDTQLQYAVNLLRGEPVPPTK